MRQTASSWSGTVRDRPPSTLGARVFARVFLRSMARTRAGRRRRGRALVMPGEELDRLAIAVERPDVHVGAASTHASGRTACGEVCVEQRADVLVTRAAALPQSVQRL